MLKQQLPHNRVVLANYAAVAMYLLGSATLDFVIVLAAKDVMAAKDLPVCRYISTALFAVALLPFLEILVRYLWALWFEFRAYCRWFEQA